MYELHSTLVGIMSGLNHLFLLRDDLLADILQHVGQDAHVLVSRAGLPHVEDVGRMGQDGQPELQRKTEKRRHARKPMGDCWVMNSFINI